MNVAFLCLIAAFGAGAASTLVELSWLRSATSALPGTIPAAAVVVPSFLLAWTVGSVAAGRLQDRVTDPLATAARWLAATAAASVALPWLGSALAPAEPPSGWAARLLAGAVPALPVAFGLGGTLPLLARVRSGRGLSPGRATGCAAAAVTAGGALGALGWLDLLGSPVRPTLAGALALAVAALVCFLLDDGRDGRPRRDRPAGDRRHRREAVGAVAGGDGGAGGGGEGPGGVPVPSGSRRLAGALAAAALLGGSVLVTGQLLALRLAAQHAGDSMLTAAHVLAGVHAGMAAGALLMVALPRGISPPFLVVLLLGTAVAGLGLVASRVGADGVHLPGAGRGSDVRLLAATMTIPLGLGAGSIVTAAARVPLRPLRRLGSWVGDLAGLSTLGGVAGAVAGAGWLLTAAGPGSGASPRWLALLASGGAVLVAAAAWSRRGPAAAGRGWTTALAAAATLAGAAAVPTFELPWRTGPSDVSLLARAEGPHGVISLVAQADGHTRLKVDNRFGLGGTSGAVLERRLGRVAASLAPQARNALLLGLGRGQTLAGLAATTTAMVDCVERNAQILSLELPIPYRDGQTPLGGPPRVVHADARRWLAAHRDAYDLIVGDLFVPWVTGAGDLLCLEHFHDVRRSLSSHGVFVQWLPLHQLPWPAFAAVANAFVEAFPASRLFVATPLADQPLVALVGWMESGRLPPAAGVDELLARSPTPGGPNGMADVYDLYLTDAWQLSVRFRDEPVALRERPLSELLSLGRQDDEPALAAINTRLLADLVTPLDTSSLERPPAELRANRELGVELAARAAALRQLLLARAATLTGRVPSGIASPHGARDLAARLDAALLEGWRVFPGHLAVRTALLERVAGLVAEDRDVEAGSLLEAALAERPDGPLGAALGGILIRLGHLVEAVEVLEAARELAPADRTAVLHLGAALVRSGRDDEARAALAEARARFGSSLPPLHATVLGLLEEDPEAERLARAILAGLDPGEPWRGTLRRLLGETGS